MRKMWEEEEDNNNEEYRRRRRRWLGPQSQNVGWAWDDLVGPIDFTNGLDGHNIVEDYNALNSQHDRRQRRRRCSIGDMEEWMRHRHQTFVDFERKNLHALAHNHHDLLLPLYKPPNLTSFPTSTSRQHLQSCVLPVNNVVNFATPIPHHHHQQLNLGEFKPQTTMLSTRDHHQNDLNPKAKVSYDDGKFQVEFDVKEYRPEELSIKTEGDNLIVTAKHETKTENGGSFVSKQFEQRFTLPSGVNPENISSSLSKDGTLTVSAPRDAPKFDSGVMKLTHSPPHSPSRTNAPSGGDEGLPHPKVKYDDEKFQITLDCPHYKPEELDVKVEGNSIIIQAKHEIKEAGGTRTRVFEQKFSLPNGVRSEKVSSTFGKDGVLTITAPRSNAHASSMLTTSSNSPSSVASGGVEHQMERVLSPSNWNDNFRSASPRFTTNSEYGSGIVKQDRSSIFERDPQLFSPQHADPASGGISKVQYDDDHYKILVNVKDFKPEELLIKTIGNTVLFEAKHEEKTSDGHSFTSRNISQSFTLPRGVDPEGVNSSLSKDGILTISAPLPPALKLQSNERLVPIKHR